MDFNATIDLIIRELEEAREIIDDLKKFPGAPVLQIELAKSKCRNAAEVIAILKQIQKSVPEPSSAEPGKKYDHPEPVVKENTKIHKPDKVLTEHRIEQKKQVHTESDVPESPLPEHGKKHDQAEPAIDENTIAEQNPKKPFVAPIIADTFSHLANRFNEQIGENQEDNSYMHGRRSETLSGMIGINDRFYYIREVFDGKKDVYNEALNRLENAHDLKEAKDILAEYKTERTSNEAVKQLLDLTRRRFGSHE